MQVKSGANNWIEFTKPYMPGADGWDTVRASLAQFVQPGGIGLLDPANVQAIVVNIRPFQTNVIYTGFFDGINFDAPETILPTSTTFGVYRSSNDSVPAGPELHIESFQAGSGAEISLSWSARSNWLYSVE